MRPCLLACALVVSAVQTAAAEDGRTKHAALGCRDYDLLSVLSSLNRTDLESWRLLMAYLQTRDECRIVQPSAAQLLDRKGLDGPDKRVLLRVDGSDLLFYLDEVGWGPS